MARPTEHIPPPVATPEDGVERTKLALVGEVQPTQPKPEEAAGLATTEERHGVPPGPA